MRKRLVMTTTLIIAAGFLAAFFLVALVVQQQYRQEFSKRLDAALAVMEAQSDDILEDPQRFAELLNGYLEDSGEDMRVTVLDPDGNVLGDSETEEGERENHLDRPEIQQALRTGRGYDIRESDSVGIPYFYAAVYLPGQGYLRAAMPFSVLNEVLSQMWLSMLACMALGIAAVYIACSINARKLMEPLAKLTSAARRIAGGDYSGRVEGKYKGEVGELAFSFNVMAKNTQQAMQNLQAKQQQLEGVLQGMDDGVIAVDERGRVLFLNQKARVLLGCRDLRAGLPMEGNLLVRRIARVMEDAMRRGEPLHEDVTSSNGEERQYTVYAAPVSGQKRVTALAVIADVTRMRRLEQMRSEFVANVTHELKTPLTSIRGSIELLKSADRDEETRRYFYDVLDIEAERLHHLIDDMLTLSQIENAKEDPTLVQCDAAEEIQKAVARLARVAESNQVAVRCSLEPGITVECSPQRLQQVIGNLVENAIKYNVPHGAVTVTAVRQRQMAVIRVADTGIGIAPEHIPRLFERFYRVDTSRSREIGGTGLGLSIVKHIAALYRGDVSVESAPGRGSTFTLRLPLAAPEKSFEKLQEKSPDVPA